MVCRLQMVKHLHPSTDLTRMYNLVLRIPNGMSALKARFGSHVQAQGLAAVEKCGEAALNVSVMVPWLVLVVSVCVMCHSCC